MTKTMDLVVQLQATGIAVTLENIDKALEQEKKSARTRDEERLLFNLKVLQSELRECLPALKDKDGVDPKPEVVLDYAFSKMQRVIRITMMEEV